MQLVTFRQRGQVRLGVHIHRSGSPYVIDLNRVSPEVPSDILLMLGAGPSALSTVMSLEPGDVIATGTPAKLPEAVTHQRFLEAGDVIRITIDEIGTLENPVAVEAATT